VTDDASAADPAAPAIQPQWGLWWAIAIGGCCMQTALLFGATLADVLQNRAGVLQLLIDTVAWLLIFVLSLWIAHRFPFSRAHAVSRSCVYLGFVLTAILYRSTLLW
jgi:hypothetical protein